MCNIRVHTLQLYSALQTGDIAGYRVDMDRAKKVSAFNIVCFSTSLPKQIHTTTDSHHNGFNTTVSNATDSRHNDSQHNDSQLTHNTTNSQHYEFTTLRIHNTANSQHDEFTT
eukprot:1333419-Amorphochlora_amoeboformis.AAC.1